MTKRHGLKIQDPNNPDKQVKVWFSSRDLVETFKHDRLQYYNIGLAVEILNRPTLIFEGIRKHSAGGWCFVGKAGSWYVRPEVEAPFPPGFVCVVFVSSTRYVYNWRLEKEDENKMGYPKDSKTRFGRQIWPSTS